MSKHHHREPHLGAEQIIKSSGQRVTKARIAVLERLLAAEYALSHQEIEQQLIQHQCKVDRVTLYRVLDWALQHEIVHKVTGEDRVWRFSATKGTDHAHFSCTQCGQVYCLEALSPAVTLSMPEGFVLQQADLAVQGICPNCSD